MGFLFSASSSKQQGSLDVRAISFSCLSLLFFFADFSEGTRFLFFFAVDDGVRIAVLSFREEGVIGLLPSLLLSLLLSVLSSPQGLVRKLLLLLLLLVLVLLFVAVALFAVVLFAVVLLLFP